MHGRGSIVCYIIFLVHIPWMGIGFLNCVEKTLKLWALKNIEKYPVGWLVNKSGLC